MLDKGYWAKKGRKMHYVDGETTMCDLPAKGMFRIVFPKRAWKLQYCAACIKSLEMQKEDRAEHTDSGQLTLPLGQG